MNAVTTRGPGGGGLTPSGMGEAMQLASMMARGRLVPKHLQGSDGDCLMVIEQAMRWGMSPFAVAQCTSVINGKLMFEGKLVAAAIQSCGLLAGRLNYEFSGKGDDLQVTCTGLVKGETVIREVMVRLRDARTSNEMWKKQPEQQLVYSSTRVWGRRHAPEVMLGVYAPEEMEAARQPEPYAAGPTIEGQAEAAPAAFAQPSAEERAAAWADTLMARVRSCTSTDDLVALTVEKGVRAGRERLRTLLPHVDDEVAHEMAQAEARLSGGVDEPPHDPATGELVDMEAP